jgi:hypothetical protein
MSIEVGYACVSCLVYASGEGKDSGEGYLTSSRRLRLRHRGLRGVCELVSYDSVSDIMFHEDSP